MGCDLMDKEQNLISFIIEVFCIFPFNSLFLSSTVIHYIAAHLCSVILLPFTFASE